MTDWGDDHDDYMLMETAEEGKKKDDGSEMRFRTAMRCEEKTRVAHTIMRNDQGVRSDSDGNNMHIFSN